jgi:molecular chaperone GrpE
MGRRKMMPQPEAEQPETKPEAAESETSTENESAEVKVKELETGHPEKALEDARAEATRNLAGWQRAQADFSNYKKTCQQEKEDNIKYGNTNIILKILPVLDDFERALTTISDDENNASLREGMMLVDRKFRKILEAQGLSEIKALGEPFDPNVHEAVMQVEGEEGKIMMELEKGYKLYDRVIRASKVAVGNGAKIQEKEK